MFYVKKIHTLNQELICVSKFCSSDVSSASSWSILTLLPGPMCWTVMKSIRLPTLALVVVLYAERLESSSSTGSEEEYLVELRRMNISTTIDHYPMRVVLTSRYHRHYRGSHKKGVKSVHFVAWSGLTGTFSMINTCRPFLYVWRDRTPARKLARFYRTVDC